MKLATVIQGFVNSSFNPKSLYVAPCLSPTTAGARAIQTVRRKDAMYSRELTRITSRLLLKKPRKASLRSASTSSPNTRLRPMEMYVRVAPSVIPAVMMPVATMRMVIIQ
jgi:hypothetical protein